MCSFHGLVKEKADRRPLSTVKLMKTIQRRWRRKERTSRRGTAAFLAPNSRIPLCDIAIHDPEVVADHYKTNWSSGDVMEQSFGMPSRLGCPSNQILPSCLEANRFSGSSSD